MIVKSYEIQKKRIDILKYNLFLVYGENIGLKKDIKKKIQFEIKQKNTNIEISSLYESDILEDTNNFYNSIYSGSLFGTTKVIAVNNGTDKIIKLIEDITEKYPENVFIIILSEILDKNLKFIFLMNTRIFQAFLLMLKFCLFLLLNRLMPILEKYLMDKK